MGYQKKVPGLYHSLNISSRLSAKSESFTHRITLTPQNVINGKTKSLPEKFLVYLKG